MLISSEIHNVPSGKINNRSCGIVRWFKLISLNLSAFGLELCASAGFSYIPPLMLKKGFSDSALSRIVGIGPLISLLLVPLIGRWSDSCQSKFGRRRPFMLVLGLLILLSLLMIPFCDEIAELTYSTFNSSAVLAVGVIGLDFSTQAIMNPCKALIPDLFESVEEQDSAFAIYSFMLAAGGFIGYLISSIDWVGTYFGNVFGGQEKVVFCSLAVIFLCLLVVNLLLAKEVPFEKINGFANGIIKEINEDHANILIIQPESNFQENHHKSIKHCVPECFKCHYCEFSKRSRFSCLKFPSKGIFFCGRSGFKRMCCCFISLKKLLFEIKICFIHFLKMPPVLFYLFLSNVFGWMAVMCHDLYYTDFVGQVIYKGRPNAEIGSLSLDLYDQGVRMGSWGLLFHCLTASAYSGLIYEKFTAKFGLANAYFLGTVIFMVCMIGTIQTDGLILVNIFCAISGIGYSTLTTVPCSLVTIYHSSRKEYYGNKENRGIGEDMAVLDSASLKRPEFKDTVCLGNTPCLRKGT